MNKTKLLIIGLIVLFMVGISALSYYMKAKRASFVDKGEFSGFTNTENIEENLHEGESVGFAWQENAPSVDEIFQNKNGEALKNVLNSVYKDETRLFSCKGGADKGILLVAQSTPENVSDPYGEARKKIIEWEPFMASDLNAVLYPEVVVPQSTTLSFSDMGNESRSANFSVNDTPRGLYYGWTLNYVALTTSPECLNGALQTVYPIHE